MIMQRPALAACCTSKGRRPCARRRLVTMLLLTGLALGSLLAIAALLSARIDHRHLAEGEGASPHAGQPLYLSPAQRLHLSSQGQSAEPAPQLQPSDARQIAAASAVRGPEITIFTVLPDVDLEKIPEQSAAANGQRPVAGADPAAGSTSDASRLHAGAVKAAAKVMRVPVAHVASSPGHGEQARAARLTLGPERKHNQRSSSAASIDSGETDPRNWSSLWMQQCPQTVAAVASWLELPKVRGVSDT